MRSAEPPRGKRVSAGRVIPSAPWDESDMIIPVSSPPILGSHVCSQEKEEEEKKEEEEEEEKEEEKEEEEEEEEMQSTMALGMSDLRKRYQNLHEHHGYPHQDCPHIKRLQGTWLTTHRQRMLVHAL